MQNLEPSVRKKVNHWLEGNYDNETKTAIQSMLDGGQYTELTDAFYKDLEFGTGGLRGIMGPGSNRVNKYTLGMATQGLSNYLKKPLDVVALTEFKLLFLSRLNYSLLSRDKA